MVLSTSSITIYTSLVTHIVPGHHNTTSSGRARALEQYPSSITCTYYSFRHSTVTRNIRYTAVNNMWIDDFTYSVRMNTASPAKLSWWCSGDVVATAQAINSPLHRLCHLRDGHLAHWSPSPKLEHNMFFEEKHMELNWNSDKMLFPSAKYHEMWMPAPQPRTSCTRSAIHGKHQKFRIQINKRVINNRVSYVYDEQQ
jgi:hypothetical protein